MIEFILIPDFHEVSTRLGATIGAGAGVIQWDRAPVIHVLTGDRWILRETSGLAATSLGHDTGKKA